MKITQVLLSVLKTSKHSKSANGCLSGVTILDLTRVLAGPFCTQFLSDLGARVIKVERPGEGDETRGWPPFLADSSDGSKTSTYFMSVNRNKESIAIDMKNPDGVKLIHELSHKSDVLIENFIPGTMDRLGLSFDSLSKHHPKGLIYTSISGWGSEFKRPGYDVIAASVAGLLSLTGPEDGPPCKPGVPVVDMVTGLYASNGILAALLEKTRNPSDTKSIKIDADLISSQVSILIYAAVNFLNLGVVATRRGTAHESVVPYQSFACKRAADDQEVDYITVGSGNDKMFVRLIEILFADFPEDKEDILTSQKFKTAASRVEHRTELVSRIQKVFSTKTKEEWIARLEGSGLPFGPVNRIDQVFEDEIIKSRTTIDVEGVQLLRSALRFFPPTMMGNVSHRFPPKKIGQDTDHILSTMLGMGEREIAILKKRGVVA